MNLCFLLWVLIISQATADVLLIGRCRLSFLVSEIAGQPIAQHFSCYVKCYRNCFPDIVNINKHQKKILSCAFCPSLCKRRISVTAAKGYFRKGLRTLAENQPSVHYALSFAEDVMFWSQPLQERAKWFSDMVPALFESLRSDTDLVSCRRTTHGIEKVVMSAFQLCTELNVQLWVCWKTKAGWAKGWFTLMVECILNLNMHKIREKINELQFLCSNTKISCWLTFFFRVSKVTDSILTTKRSALLI